MKATARANFRKAIAHDKVAEWLEKLGSKAAWMRSLLITHLHHSVRRTFHILLPERSRGPIDIAAVNIGCRYEETGIIGRWEFIDDDDSGKSNTSPQATACDRLSGTLAADIKTMFHGITRDEVEVETWEEVLDRVDKAFREDALR